MRINMKPGSMMNLVRRRGRVRGSPKGEGVG
jgi:hypothetical protein